MTSRARSLVPLLAAFVTGCGHGGSEPPGPAEPPASVSAPAPQPVESAEPPEKRAIALLAGGDISFGRLQGQMLLHDPGIDFFTGIRAWLDAADVRFANLEGPISDQHGETVKPGQPLVFTGPPEGAAALARAPFTVVSTANNHAWDYGKPALLETVDLLDGAGVAHAGTGRDRDEARRPAIVESGGLRLAVLAVTDIWNDGELARHPADAYVARAEADSLAEAVRAARAGGADAVVVSYHGGVEYGDTPLPRAREILHAAIDAGADAVLGHHPHVVQGVEWYRRRPIFYSMGNLLMRMHRDHPWTELAFMARLSLSPGGGAKSAEVCPFRIHGLEQRPLAGDARREGMERWFYDHLASISRPLGGLKIDAPGPDGCAAVHPS